MYRQGKEFYSPDFKVGQIFEFSSSFYKSYDKGLEEELCKYFDLNTKKSINNCQEV